MFTCRGSWERTRPSASAVMGQTGVHYGRHGKGGGSTHSSQPSVSCSGMCEIASWNLGARTQRSIVTAWFFPVPHGSDDSKMSPLLDPLMPVTFRHGKVAPWQFRVGSLYMAEEGNDSGFVFVVNGHDAHFNCQSQFGHEDTGELLLASASLDPRTAVVLETTVDDARSVRQFLDVNHNFSALS